MDELFIHILSNQLFLHRHLMNNNRINQPAHSEVIFLNTHCFYIPVISFVCVYSMKG